MSPVYWGLSWKFSGSEFDVENETVDVPLLAEIGRNFSSLGAIADRTDTGGAAVIAAAADLIDVQATAIVDSARELGLQGCVDLAAFVRDH